MSQTLQRLWVQLTADRRRFGVLCAVMTVGLLLWARLIIVSNMPRTAVADSPGAVAGGASSSSSSPTGKARGDRAVSSADKSNNQTGLASAKSARNVMDVRLDHLADRDPFVISPAHFPKLASLPEMKPNGGKLPTEAAEDPSQKEARLSARLLQLLGSVRLEAVMGANMAVIGGRTYRLGERLPPQGQERAEFTLAEVKARSVVLEHQGRRFEIEMSNPGNKQ